MITEGRRGLVRAGEGLENLGQSAAHIDGVAVDELERGADASAPGIELLGLHDVLRIDCHGGPDTDELEVYESLHGGEVYFVIPSGLTAWTPVERR